MTFHQVGGRSCLTNDGLDMEMRTETSLDLAWPHCKGI